MYFEVVPKSLCLLRSLLETCKLHGTSKDFIYLPDGTAGSGNLRLGGSRARDMIRLLTQTYENSNKGLWATRDLRDNNEIYEAHMLQRKEDTKRFKWGCHNMYL
jgi:hypothetical protein